MKKGVSLFVLFLLIFYLSMPWFSPKTTAATVSSSDSRISLGADLTDWVLDSTHNTIYAITAKGNLDFISTDPFKITKTISVGGNPSDVDQVGQKLYVALPDLKKIKVIDLTTGTVTKTISTTYTPYRIAVGTNKLFYVPKDQWCNLYEYDLTSSAEKEVTIQSVANSSFYEPALAINKDTGTLYIGESGSASSIIAISTSDYSLKSKSTYDYGYGFPNSERRLILDGDSVFYAGRELNANNLADIRGTYYENATESAKGIVGLEVGDILAVTDHYVYTKKGVFDRDTFVKAGSHPSTDEMDFILKSSNYIFYTGTDHSTIHRNQYTPPLPGIIPLWTENNVLTTRYGISDWVLDEATHRLYAISEAGNRLLEVNTETMTVADKTSVGSAPSDIDLVNGKLYIADFGGTEVRIVDPGTLDTIKVLHTKQNPYKITTDGKFLYYVTEDQWSYIYRVDISSGSDTKLEIPNSNVSTYFEPDIQLDPSTNRLYVGETGMTGSNLYVVDPTNGSRLAKTDYDNGYGFSFPSRRVILDGNDVYYAGHRLSKSDVTKELDKYFDSNSEDLVYENNAYVFTDQSIYDKSTLQKVFSFPCSTPLAAMNSKGNIFVYVPHTFGIYRFDSLAKLQNREVENLQAGFDSAGHFQLTWNDRTADMFDFTAGKNITGETVRPYFKLSDEDLKSFYGKTITFGVSTDFCGEQSAVTKISHFFPIPIPQNLKTKEGNGVLSLSWDPIKLMDGYNLYYYTDDKTSKTLINKAPITKDTYQISKELAHQLAGEQVHFVATSVVNGKESKFSDPVSYTFVVPVPKNLTAKESDGAMSLSWDSISYMDGYNLYYYTDDPTSKTLVNEKPIIDPTYQIPEKLADQLAGQKVTFVATSMANGKESKVSDPVSYTFTVPVPKNLTAKESDGAASFSWDSIPYMDGYNLYYYTDNKDTKTLVNKDLITKNTYQVPGKLSSQLMGEKVNFIVTSVAKGKESKGSDPVAYTFPKTDPNPSSGDQSGSGTDNGTGSNTSSATGGAGQTGGQAGGGSQTNTGSSNQSTSGGSATQTNQSSSDQTSTTQNQDSSSDQGGQTQSTQTGGVIVAPVISGNQVTFSGSGLTDLQTGGQVNINLKQDDHDTVNVVVSETEMETLKNQDAVIGIHKTGVSLEVPVVNLPTNNKTTITVTKLDHFKGAIGPVYNFAIHQGSQVVDKFSVPVTLSFKVDPNLVTNPDLLKIYYWNVGKKQWQLIGGTYKDGVVTAETSHFSTYGVFEKNHISASGPTIGKTENASFSVTGPEKQGNSTSYWIYVVIGLIVVVGGAIAFFVTKRKLA